MKINCFFPLADCSMQGRNMIRCFLAISLRSIAVGSPLIIPVGRRSQLPEAVMGEQRLQFWHTAACFFISSNMPCQNSLFIFPHFTQLPLRRALRFCTVPFAGSSVRASACVPVLRGCGALHSNPPACSRTGSSTRCNKEAGQRAVRGEEEEKEED